MSEWNGWAEDMIALRVDNLVPDVQDSAMKWNPIGGLAKRPMQLFRIGAVPCHRWEPSEKESRVLLRGIVRLNVSRILDDHADVMSSSTTLDVDIDHNHRIKCSSSSEQRRASGYHICCESSPMTGTLKGINDYSLRSKSIGDIELGRLGSWDRGRSSIDQHIYI